jgi:hypothetical protein
VSDEGVCGGSVPPLFGDVLTGTSLTLAEAAARLERGDELPELTPLQLAMVERYVVSRA